jgi:hypothetical protein
MAERLPRYRPLGVRIPGVPSVNYAQTGRAQAAVFETLSRSLDQMAEFAYEKQKAKVQVEGAEYGVANAPTPEQFKVAAQDPEKPVVIPGDKETVFGMAARKAAIDTAQAQLTTATRNEITALRLEAQATDMPVAEFTQKAQNIIDGYGSALSGVSPAAGVNYKAGMAASVNSSVLAYAEKALAEQEKADKANAELGIGAIITGPIDSDDDISTLRDIFSAGSTFEAQGQPGVSITDKINQARQEVIRQASPFDADYLKSKLKDFDDKVDELFVTEISDWAISSPAVAFAEINSGKITDPKISDLWGKMSAEQKRAAEDDIMTRMSAKHSLESQMDAKRERARKDLAEQTVVKIAKARLAGNEDEVAEGLSELALYDGDKYANLSETILQTGNFDDPSVINMLEIAALNGDLSQTMVMNAYSSGRLSNPTFVSMLEKIDAQRNDDHTQAMKFVRATLAPEVMPGTIYSGTDTSHKKAAKKIAEIEAELILEVRRNPSVNRLEFVKPLVEAAGGVDETELANQRKNAERRLDAGRRAMGNDDATLQEVINYYEGLGKRDYVDLLEVLVE